MNKLILEELKRVKVAKVPEFSDDTLVIHIPKGASTTPVKSQYVPPVDEFEIGKVYRVKVDKSLVDPNSKWYETIHGNWNGGKGLSEMNIDIKVLERYGKMIKVEAIGTNDIMYTWSGFLPQGNINKVMELK